MQSHKSWNTVFFNYDLKNNNKRKKILNFIKQKKWNKKEIVVFFSDSFDVLNLEIITADFIKFKNLYLVLVNTRNYKILGKKFIIIDKFFFKNKNRNIILLKNAKR